MQFWIIPVNPHFPRLLSHLSWIRRMATQPSHPAGTSPERLQLHTPVQWPRPSSGGHRTEREVTNPTSSCLSPARRGFPLPVPPTVAAGGQALGHHRVGAISAISSSSSPKYSDLSILLTCVGFLMSHTFGSPVFSAVPASTNTW